jgi:hypothetical protein
MADEQKTAGSVTISLGDPRVWAVIVALLGGQFAANKLSFSGVENSQQKASETAAKASDAAVKAVETQVSIDDKLERITRFQGELSYRLEQTEKRYQELKDAIESKGKK